MTKNLPAVLQPQNLGEVVELARHLQSAEGMIPKQYVGNVGKIVAATLKGMELGVGAITAMNSFHVVEGKAVADYSFWIAQLKRHGYRIEWLESTDKRAVLKLTDPDGVEHQETYTFEMAKRAGLTGKQNWKCHTEAMLKARATTAAGRAFAAEVMAGCYTPDEAEEIRETTAHVVTTDKPKQGAAGLAERLGVTEDPEPEAEPEEPEESPAEAPETGCFDNADEAVAEIDQCGSLERLRELKARCEMSGFIGADKAQCVQAIADRYADLVKEAERVEA